MDVIHSSDHLISLDVYPPPVISMDNGSGKRVEMDFSFFAWLMEQYKSRRELFPECHYCHSINFRLNMRDGKECSQCGAPV